MTEIDVEAEAAKKDWCKSEIEELIIEYEQYPCLWDVHHREYRDRIKKAEAWEKLAAKFAAEMKEVQRKIHNLRNQFHNETKKEKKIKSGNGTQDKFVSKWPHYQTIRFIQCANEGRKSKDNLVSFLFFLHTQ